ncbi:MAG TPA: ABC transporter permease [Tepidisphaeraceae bacterium]|nr:ABC transporter permease [Tepidisphaeraceae bacterium]
MSGAQLVAQPVREDQQQLESARSGGLLRPALSLAQRELVRFLRQRHRIIGALATPIVFWLLIGGGMGRSISVGSAGESYIRFFFPGTLVMILLFTAIFSTISIIEDRREGFLQSVLVAPIPRQTIVLGKVLGGTVLASGQGLIFLLLAPLVGFHFTIASLLLCVFLMIVISFALTALGFCIAWRMSSTQGFHAIMNLFLMPMWFLSGALFPPDGAWWGLKWVMRLNPLTYGLSALRHSMLPGTASGGPGLWTSTVVSCVFAVVLFFLAGQVAKRTIAADLQ